MVPTCPHCMEDRYKDVENSENRSVASHRSNKSSRSIKSSRSVKSSSRSIKSSSRGSNNKKAVSKCPFDEKGYCHVHAHIRLAKKKLTGWKILQEFCIECANEDEDNQTACSRSSRMSRKSSSSSRRSRRRSSSSKSQRSRCSSSSYCKDEEVYSQISSQSEQSKSKKTPSRSSEKTKKSKMSGE